MVRASVASSLSFFGREELEGVGRAPRPAARRSGSWRGHPAVVVLQADDVVLAEVGAVLHLDEDDVASPSLAMRCAPSSGMSMESPGPNSVTTPSRVTVAVPDTTNQCSARLAWRW